MIKLKKVKYGYALFVNGRQVSKIERSIYDPVSFGFVDLEIDYKFESNGADASDWIESYCGYIDDILDYLDELNHLMFCWNMRNDKEDCFHINEYRCDNDIFKKISRRDYYNMKHELINIINREIERI